MSMQTTLRVVARDTERLDARVATVETSNGVRTSEQYAVAFVRKYQWDQQQIRDIFGAAYDIEDLQHEMLYAMYKAANYFLKTGATGSWKAYLSRCLKTRLWVLGTKDVRRAVHHPKSESLQEYLACCLEFDWYTGYIYTEIYHKALTVEDVYQQIDDLNQARRFLESLTARQRKIILLRWEHVPGTNDGAANIDVAQALGISEKTLNNELLRIQRTFAEYALVHHETEWMAYLEKLRRKHEIY